MLCHRVTNCVNSTGYGVFFSPATVAVHTTFSAKQCRLRTVGDTGWYMLRYMLIIGPGRFEHRRLRILLCPIVGCRGRCKFANRCRLIVQSRVCVDVHREVDVAVAG